MSVARTVAYREQVFVVGGEDGLVGILTEPVASPRGHRPVVILVNAGMLHRVGPCRNTVLLARTLADAGYTSYRFDYEGTGDSSAGTVRTEAGMDANTAQIKCAMDSLTQKTGAGQFVVYGLCSGARDAFHAAVADERIVGVGQIDSFSYRNRGYLARKILRKLLDITSWWHSIRVRLMPDKAEDGAGDDLSVAVWPAYPPRTEIEEKYAQLVARGVRFFTVYTGSWNEVYNYEQQLYDLFRVKGLSAHTKLLYLPGADHLFSGPVFKQKVYSEFVDYLASLDKSGRTA